ncbi:MAG: hypothetical protein QOH92_2713 [Chloroflexota bacterium]|jgi:hypothetical protein|nr:hypothetical protein [Chloroflexota bacterium]
MESSPWSNIREANLVEVFDMTTTMRRRVIVLQVGLIGILVFCAGFLFWGNSFIHNQISTELTAQQIYFPAADNKAIASLPAADAAAMSNYGGQQLTTGSQAQVYANSFIGVHLSEVAGGLTYSQMSAQAIANPTDQKMAGQVATLFKGETLRGLLLNAYGWWTIGTYALYAAIGLALAAFAVLVALAFEIFLAIREPRKVKVPVLTTKLERLTA